ncbi:MAG: alpha-1,4-glucan--maltose-1-phosphate maltosyltransferase [Dehalococcoidia bacterium]|nr:alpha-1,4-glucan--maltose-1-phosphate maltosyltransferase [Dehalococcoidia bacterium]
MSVPRLRRLLPPPYSHRPSRVVVDAVFPSVDGGRHPAKAIAGDPVFVRAHVFADGHDVLRAVARYRRLGEKRWSETPLTLATGDEWEGWFTAGAPGEMEFTVEGWVDRFATWRADLEKRITAEWDVSAELLDGAALLRRLAGHAKGDTARGLKRFATRIEGARGSYTERVEAALDPLLAALAQAADPREGATNYRHLRLVVEPQRARFGAWYEFFPRSAGTDPTRSATFAEAAARLPDIAAMGFDVIYLPPIHPIGTTARKGRNNALVAQPDDPGSPWGIGSLEGGHMAVHPDLGTLEDFDRFLEQAAGHGLDVALDLALQCSPDHPWVTEHPEWFRHRPDGSIRYAENPPKQYQDIYPLNFETEDWAALWLEIRKVVDFWIGHGVNIFRVDNPHTKPFRFWHWLIAGVHETHPEVIFLAEAFTRPKVQQALAKFGFSQSYTYFTWRNTKAQIEQFFTELTQRPLADYFRPNLFANTPDILHAYLQEGGKPAFLVRLVLAATLGPSYGIYSGFEFCENVAVEGTEEYLDSEKYEIKPRDWDAPGNIKPTITRLNFLRREYAALQFNHRVWFLPTNDDHVVACIKRPPLGGPDVLVVVNLDVTSARDAWFGLPLESLGLPLEAPFLVEDALSGVTQSWAGEWNHVRLDPEVMPAAVFILPERANEEPA